MQEEGVVSVASFVGRGAARFMLTYAPEQPNTAYGQLIVRVEDRAMIDPLAARLRADLGVDFPQAEIRTERLFFGPGGGARIEARFSGPDAATLRRLGEEAAGRMRAKGGLIDIRQNWRQREMVITPVFNEERARIAGLGRADLAQVMNFSTTGLRAGTYREGDELIPIIARPPAYERLDPGQLRDRLVASPQGDAFVPVAQIVDRFELVPEETLIRRRDRVRTLTVQADPVPGMTADEARQRVLDTIETIDLPPGYRLEWGGEFEASVEAEESLGRQLPLGFLVMELHHSRSLPLRQNPAAADHLGLCGGRCRAWRAWFWGCWIRGLGLIGFMALPGIFSACRGMLMKNAIVLVRPRSIMRRIAFPRGARAFSRPLLGLASVKSYCAGDGLAGSDDDFSA